MSPRRSLGPLALALALTTGCGFTNEPDPGFEDADGGLGGPYDAGLADASPISDADQPPPGDMGAAPDATADLDAAPTPADGGADAALDGGAPDAAPDAASDGAATDAAAPDSGPLGPADHCDRACAALTACGPGPDPAECRRECLAEDDDHPGTAARLDGCVAAHVADGRCDLPALQQCMSDEPLPIDPHCLIACDRLSACDLPARPDCAEGCTEEPGPDRQRLARCVEAHVGDGRCDGIGFIGCADTPPTAEDECAFVCDSHTACGLDAADCLAPCLDLEPPARLIQVDCAARHLDRGVCDGPAHRACLAR